MRGRKKSRRGRLSREEQPVIDRCCQHRALVGVAGQRVGVGAAGKGIVGPARFRERLEFAAKIIAEEAHDLIDTISGKRARALLDDWAVTLGQFVKVMPRDYSGALQQLEAERLEAATVAAE